MENNKNDVFDKLQCSNIEEKIDKSLDDIQDININKNNIKIIQMKIWLI